LVVAAARDHLYLPYGVFFLFLAVTPPGYRARGVP
jgi:hypothetical protein